MQSPDGEYHLSMQTDGNLVVYDRNGAAHWADWTFGMGSNLELRMQPDGDAVVYKPGVGVVWHTSTAGSGADRFRLGDDGRPCSRSPTAPSCGRAPPTGGEGDPRCGRVRETRPLVWTRVRRSYPSPPILRGSARVLDALRPPHRDLQVPARQGPALESDIDATVREIRRALLDADVALPVVREFTATIRERALSAEVSQALNPAQQVVKIVHEELVTVLGGETRRLDLAKTPPTVILLAGLQGAGKTTLAGKLGRWLKEQGHTPLLVAADLQRPNAVDQLQVVGERAGVAVFAPHPGIVHRHDDGGPRATRWRSPATGSGSGPGEQHDVVIVDTAGRLGVDAELMQQAADIRDAVQPDEMLFVVDAMIGQDAVTTAQAFKDGVGFTGVVLSKLDGDARGGAALSVAGVTGRPIMFASHGGEARRVRGVPPRPDGVAHPRHGRRPHPDRAGREGVRRRAGRGDGREVRRRGGLHVRRLPGADGRR